MSNLRLNKIKSQTPISIIIHGGNRLGYLTAKSLIEQGSYVVIIDKYNSKTKKHIAELKKSELFDFFDFRGLDSLFKNLKRFDYLFYFLNEKLVQDDFDSKEFLTETKTLEDTLIQTKKNNAKFSLITSLQLNRELANRVNNIKMAAPSPYSDIELQKYCETLVAEFKDRSNINLRILRIGTVVGKGVEKIQDTVLDGLFDDATQKAQITIKGEGLDVHSLIHETDAVYGILKLTFTDSTKGEVVSLANKNNYTTLSLAYKLLELNTEAQTIRFVENPEADLIIQDLYVPAPYATKYGWIQQVSLEDALIEQIQKYYDSGNKKWALEEAKLKKEESKKEIISTSQTKLGDLVSNIKAIIKKPSQVKSLDYKKSVKMILASIGIFIATYFFFAPIITILLGLLIINTTAKDLSSSIFSIDENKSTETIEKLDRNIDRISRGVNNLYWLFYITNQGNLYDNTNQLILGSQYAIQGSTELLSATTPLYRYVQEFQPALDFQTSIPTTTREYREYLEDIEENSYKLDEAAYRISLASEIIQDLDTTAFPKVLQDHILTIKDLVSQLEVGTKTFKDATIFIPDLLGVDERKRYLILFQNESEIRSTGGWLTSYGIIGIEGGQVRELFVDDIYNADGTLRVQNKTQIPPKSMINALEITDWSFSLVNWQPDLLDTMRDSETFVKDLGQGNNLDGLITIDITFIQKLLEEWGGIEVPGETELITSENIYTKIFEMHSTFTPGSTQKTTFLANLANEIVQKILAMQIPELIAISDIFEESLNEKHLQATFANSEAYDFFSTRNWSNSLDSRYNDAPIAIDWNWGGNKANLYLEKNYNLQIDIKDEDTVDFVYSITTENSSSTNTYPEGDYENYQRIYIPTDATILRINGFEDNEYDNYRESGFKVIGGWFNIPIQSTGTLEISYRITRTDSSFNFPLQRNEENIFFDINLFKQSGEKNHAYKIDISYPSTWNLENSGNLNSISSQLSGRFNLDRDLEIPLVWRVPN